MPQTHPDRPPGAGRADYSEYGSMELEGRYGPLYLCDAGLLRSTSAPYGANSPRNNGSLHAAAGRWRPEPRLSAGRESPVHSQPGSDAGEPNPNGGVGGGSLPSSPRRMPSRRQPLERGELPASRPYERLPAPPPLPGRPPSRGGSPSRDGSGMKESGSLPSSSGVGPTSFRGIGQLTRVTDAAPGAPQAASSVSALPPPPALPELPAGTPAAGRAAIASSTQQRGLLAPMLDMDSYGSADLSVLSQVCFSRGDHPTLLHAFR